MQKKPMKKIRLDLYRIHTIGNFGMIPVFTPDEILICDEETGRKRSVDAMVGINEKDVPAIFNPKLLC